MLGGGAHCSIRSRSQPSPTRPARQHGWRAFVGARANGSQTHLLTPCLRSGGSRSSRLKQIPRARRASAPPAVRQSPAAFRPVPDLRRSEEHTSELQSLMRNSYAVFSLKKKKTNHTQKQN